MIPKQQFSFYMTHNIEKVQIVTPGPIHERETKFLTQIFYKRGKFLPKYFSQGKLKSNCNIKMRTS